MGKARVLGSKAVLKIIVPNVTSGSEILIGEIDKFTATSQSEVKKSQPLGQGHITSQQVFKGWEISLEAGKVDWRLAMEIVGVNDAQTVQTGRSGLYRITQTIEYYDGQIETWQYDDVTFYGYELSAESAEEEIKETIKGFSGRERTLIAAGDLQETEANQMRTNFVSLLEYINLTEKWGTSLVNKFTDNKFNAPD